MMIIKIIITSRAAELGRGSAVSPVFMAGATAAGALHFTENHLTEISIQRNFISPKKSFHRKIISPKIFPLIALLLHL